MHAMRDIRCQDHTKQEVIDLLIAEAGCFTDPESRARLAKWIKQGLELEHAIYDARVAFADAERRIK